MKRSSMVKKVDKQILDLYYKYDEDLDLLNERGARKKDRESVSHEQAVTLGTFIEKLEFLKVKNLSSELRNRTINEIKELEQHIEPDVIKILKEKIHGSEDLSGLKG